MNKTCAKCRTTLLINEFTSTKYLNKKGEAVNHYNKTCKLCMKTVLSDRYHRNKSVEKLAKRKDELFSFNGDDAIYC